METDKKDIYYLEDHIWSTGNTMEEKAQYAEQYIKKYIDIMEENRGFYMEKALTKEPINGYQRIINKNLLNNAN